MEITKTQIDLKAFGQEYKLNPPTALKSAQFQKDMKAAQERNDSVEILEKSAEFLMSCGLPKEVCDQLELDHYTQLIDLIVSKKK